MPQDVAQSYGFSASDLYHTVDDPIAGVLQACAGVLPASKSSVSDNSSVFTEGEVLRKIKK